MPQESHIERHASIPKKRSKESFKEPKDSLIESDTSSSEESEESEENEEQKESNPIPINACSDIEKIMCDLKSEGKLEFPMLKPLTYVDQDPPKRNGGGPLWTEQEFELLKKGCEQFG